ncbi:MAG: hypothetical protein QW251_04620, partial [Desulfurococcaceae archaeon]
MIGIGFLQFSIDHPHIARVFSGFRAFVIAIHRPPSISIPIHTVSQNHSSQVDVIAWLPHIPWVYPMPYQIPIPRG